MIKYGTIGSGWIVDAFVEAASRVKGLKYNVVYSRSQERAKEFAIKHDVEYTATDLESMAKSKYIDAVYIASPNVCHYEQSMLFLKNKKHVICEKPVAMSEKEAAKLFETAHENGVVFMEAIMSYNSPQFKLLKSAVGQIGEIKQAIFNYCQLSSKYQLLLAGENPNIFNPKIKAGSVMDIGIYCVYVALALFGRPQTINADAVTLENGVDICGSARFKYADGLITINHSKVGNSRGVSEIIGDKGTVTIDKISYLDGIRFFDNDNNEIKIFYKEETEHQMYPEAQQFYNYITDFDNFREQYRTSANLSIMVADVLHKIRQESRIPF